MGELAIFYNQLLFRFLQIYFGSTLFSDTLATSNLHHSPGLKHYLKSVYYEDAAADALDIIKKVADSD